MPQTCSGMFAKAWARFSVDGVAAHLELTRFRGDPILLRGGGIRDVEVQTAVPGGVPPADGRAGSIRTNAGGPITPGPAPCGATTASRHMHRRAPTCRPFSTAADQLPMHRRPRNRTPPETERSPRPRRTLLKATQAIGGCRMTIWRQTARAHSRFPGHALTSTGVMAIRCKQFHLPDL